MFRLWRYFCRKIPMDSGPQRSKSERLFLLSQMRAATILITALICWSHGTVPAASTAASLSGESPQGVIRGAINSIPATLRSLNPFSSGTQSGAAGDTENMTTDFLSQICPSSSLPPEVPNPPTREQNLQELELMLRDPGLEHAADSKLETAIAHTLARGCAETYACFPASH